MKWLIVNEFEIMFLLKMKCKQSHWLPMTEWNGMEWSEKEHGNVYICADITDMQ